MTSNVLYLKDSSNYKKTIRSLYIQDPDFIENWHTKSGKGFRSCIKNSLKAFSSNEKMFEVLINKEVIGYIGKGLYENKPYLNGFFIAPKYRQYKDEFFKMLVNEFGNNWYTGIALRNHKAIKWLIKNNLKGKFLYKSPENDDILMLEYKGF